MKASGFAYLPARSIGDAVAAFRNCEGEARYLAGGQSLLAAMNLRLLAPDLLIDISRIDELRGIELRGDEVRIGALTRHAELLTSPLIAEHVPLLAAAAPWVAHPAIRNKGTLGGSIAFADPASEFPAVALALNATVELDGGDDRRRVAAEDFFRDLYETAAEPGEIVSAVHFPAAGPDDRFAFDELARRRGDYAIVGTAIAATFAGDVVERIRIALLSVGATPFLARGAAAALQGTTLGDDDIARAQAALAGELRPSEDVHVSSETRLHLASVLLKRQLKKLREGGR
ncbi:MULTISPECIES: xanthine dehydrogenase family protein subunit M [Rhodopseudomonas]|uniref:Molybdopterin dehydrogenase n=1 Tax=Rhodopseudomonas palustris TaxID=1076 RepID=A0A0D7EJ15_RHOPL|nr:MULTISPECIES: xanthine dehydrogenase family protein subunit M [Rhodopseudomonas]KIZ40753.1 molybdopterin dehydrogenase [Rhodopseudomonas palustris]MDF3813744.1 xanthine dehydrogenase family protein subunit M [Rhodopseudomonas sp. BAL398]WOK20836.1 xanthine dehydrogenase family protein subunit M [Rhodopseudomonas sp. BAL398]